MKKTNGFTLIELLAVIVILAIIAVIATPLAINVINDAKKNAFKNTAYGLIDAVRLQYAENYLKGNTDELFYTFPEAEGLKFSGESPKGGTIRLTEEGKISLAIHNNEWCAIKDVNNSEVLVKEYLEENCILPEEADVPVISFEGKDVIYVGIGGNYTDPEFIVKTVGGEELSNSLVEVSVLGQTTGKTEIDTSIEETYEITYTITYKGNTTTETIIVHVGNYKPSIIIEPNGTDGYSQELDVTISVSAYEQYSINGFSYVIVKDGVEGNVNTVSVNDKQVSFTEDGTYQIKVSAIDSEGNTSEVTSESFNIDVTDPVITFEEGNTAGISMRESEVLTYDFRTGVIVTDNNSITLDDVVVSGNISANVGEYILTYTATDVAGNVITKSRKVIVKSDGVSFNEKMQSSGQVSALDPDGNLRYVGVNPDNYVWFNNELWRIIGVFDGQAKIIRNEYYSTAMQWHVDGENDWTSSIAQTTLNGTYLSSIQTNDSTSYSYIDLDHVWNLGGLPEDTDTFTRANIYGFERGTTVYEGRFDIWKGAVGLMYASDYGYSTSGDSSICDSVIMWYWREKKDSSAFTECAEKSWLYDSSTDGQWTLTPHSEWWYGVFRVKYDGHLDPNDEADDENAVRPVLFLKSSVKISDGKGTYDEPYQLGL